MLESVLVITLCEPWQTACIMTKGYLLSHAFLIRYYLMNVFHAFDKYIPVLL